MAYVIDSSMSPPSCLPAEVDRAALIDITRVSDKWRRYFDPATRTEHDGTMYALRMAREAQDSGGFDRVSFHV